MENGSNDLRAIKVLRMLNDFKFSTITANQLLDTINRLKNKGDFDGVNGLC